MMQHTGTILAVFLAFLAVGAVFTTRDAPLSLATDIGSTDVELCETIQTYGNAAVSRLEATRFPHASDELVEIYRLAQDREVKSVVMIDWLNREAQCVPIDQPGPWTATLVMTERAYSALIGELRNVMTTGGLSGHVLGNYWAIWYGTDVMIHEDPGANSRYEWSLAAWGAGRLTGAG